MPVSNGGAVRTSLTRLVREPAPPLRTQHRAMGGRSSLGAFDNVAYVSPPIPIRGGEHKPYYRMPSFLSFLLPHNGDWGLERKCFLSTKP